MSPLYFVLIIVISFQNVFGFKKEYCNFEDSVCMTEALQQHAFAKFVAGMPPDVEPTDPLYLETTDVCLPDSTYTIRDGILRGMKDCEVPKLKVSFMNGYDFFTSELLCRNLTLQTSNEVNSNDCTTPKKEFQCETTYHNYYLTFNGTFNTFLNTNDKEYFIHLTGSSFDSVLQGEVTHECKSLTKSKCSNKYYYKLEELARQTVMDKLQNTYMQHLITFLHLVPTKELYFRYVTEKC